MTLSRVPGGPVRDAVFIFDAHGVRCAATPGADHVVGGGRVARLTDLEKRYRQPDGLPLDIEAQGTRVAIDGDGRAGVRVTITTDALSDDASGNCVPAYIVAVRPFRGDEDPLTIQHALGSVLAHELKTPLTTIVGGSQLVSNVKTSETARQDAATSVVREAHRLNRIVEDLVVLVRSNRDPAPELEPVMVQHVLPRVVASQLELYPAADIRLAIAPRLPAVMASERPVAHVVRNLIDHALRYSPDGGAVEVRAHRTNGSVDIRVADGGPGRDEAAAQQAFELFAASGRTSLDASGANLGLVVARQLAARMGGRIRASAAPVGELTLSLPVVRAG